MKRTRGIALLLACAALLATACARSNASKTGGTGSTAPKASELPGQSAIGPLGDITQSPTTNPSASVNVAPPTLERVRCDPKGQPRATLEPQPQGRSWITAVVNYDRSWGKNGACASMRPGDDCWIPFYGAWHMEASASGSIVFQAFENTSTTPVISKEAGPIPQSGQFHQGVKLHYVPGKDAYQVTFRILLKDALDTVVAVSHPETVPIPVCGAPQS